MSQIFAGEEFQFTFATHALGCLLEADDSTGATVLVAFLSDPGEVFTFSAYRENLPFDLVEAFVKVARRRLEGAPKYR